jgi:ribosomal protein L11 methyltransferase
MFYRLTPELVLRSRWRPYWRRPGERVLTLTAGPVFPPSHPSTRLCLDLLMARLAAAGGELLDVGCGSGVLLLAGLAAGARRGVGLDISGAAAAVTRQNARVNHLSRTVLVVRGSTECLQKTFEVMVGNLPWAVQMDKVAEFTRLAAPNACLILSGFKDTQEAQLRDGYEKHGWRLEDRRTRDEWVAALPPEHSYTWVAWRLGRVSSGK